MFYDTRKRIKFNKFNKKEKMQGYLGENVVDVKDTPYVNYSKDDWALHWIFLYGGIDGAHHKDWVLDHVARILKGTKVIIKLAEWKNGEKEYRLTLDEPTKEYWDWVADCKSGDDGPETYSYEFGIAP